MTYELWRGDCRACMANMGDASVDSVVCDPPYELGFMGKSWDASGIAYDVGLWREVFRVLKPGGHVLAFGGSRTYHRLAVAIEDAGFEIRDGLIWLYGSGFPKSLNISKALDKAAGAERQVTGPPPYSRGRASQSYSDTRRVSHDYPPQPLTAPATPEARQWEGWGTALKPAHEPIVMARKPLIGTVAANVLAHGVGGLNIDACRVPGAKPDTTRGASVNASSMAGPLGGQGRILDDGAGRFPANVLHDGSDPVLAVFPLAKSEGGTQRNASGAENMFGVKGGLPKALYSDGGSAARFFYCAKASKADREAGLAGLEAVACGLRDAGRFNSGGRTQINGEWVETGSEPKPKRNTHPTVKPTDLMRWCVRLVTPPGGLVFDPFAGSGSTGRGAILEGFRFLGAELTPEYWPIAQARLDDAVNERHTARP